MNNDYKIYQSHLGNIPEFLKPYLELDILVRLKDISLLCGMDYASPHAYSFAFYVSRFDHSLNVALITWKLTHDKKATLAALFHDISTPVFSHVIDYMNGDLVNQESTEEKTEEVLRSSDKLQELLTNDNLTIEDVCDFKKYSIVDLDRPCMCADRLDNIITVGMAWAQKLTLKDALNILSATTKSINEDGLEEISFNDINIAEYIKHINDIINDLTHTNEDTYMMLLLASIIKRCIELDILKYDELFLMGEHDAIEIIESNKHIDKELEELWNLFKTIENFPLIEQPPIRNKIVNPLVLNKRIK